MYANGGRHELSTYAYKSHLDDTQASIELAVETAPYYDLSTSDARRIAREAAERIGRWRDIANRLGLARPAIERMASAFEHADQAIAMTF